MLTLYYARPKTPNIAEVMHITIDKLEEILISLNKSKLIFLGYA